MKSGVFPLAPLAAMLLPVFLALTPLNVSWAAGTLVQLIHGDTGRSIACNLLQDGETLVLTWKNSLFDLAVTEVYKAGGGLLTQTGVTFAIPGGGDPPRVKPEDVEDLFHTGGPFRADGLSRPFQKIVFRIGEIGNPILKIQGRQIALAEEVGFGGTIVLESRLSMSNEPLPCPIGAIDYGAKKPTQDR